MLAAWLLACTGDSRGVSPRLAGEDFFDRPFPDDVRLVDGHPSFEGFPHEGEFPLADAYLAASQELDGFGTNSPIWIAFDAPVDTTVLPDALGSLTPYATVQVVDVTPGSPARGEAVPLAWEWTAPVTEWQPGNFLAVAPIFGFPLRPATTYAVLLRAPLVPRDLAPDLWEDTKLRDTRDTLDGLGWSTDDVAYAWTFTTQDPRREMAEISTFIRERLSVQVLDQALAQVARTSLYTAYEGHLVLPIWQEGARPYRNEGGGFAWTEDGEPVIAQWERVAFALVVPNGYPGSNGWPVALYAHGTGGDHTTSFNSGNTDEEAAVLAQAGIAIFAVAQPLHGDRATPDTNTDLDSFNFYNPDAGRTNFRQGALDQVYLAHLLTSTYARFTTSSGTAVLDKDRVAFLGHSQGGLSGALGLPFFPTEVKGGVLSSTGGGLSITLTQRVEPIDFQLAVESLLAFDEGEEATTFHPVIGLIQTLVEVTDPLNYAPALFAVAPEWGAGPRSILLTEGMQDPLSPPDAAEALAAAARIPILEDAAHWPLSHGIRGLEEEGLPASGNVPAWSGAATTAGLAQFPDEGHYAIYNDEHARTLYQGFLTTLLAGGAPVLSYQSAVEED